MGSYDVDACIAAALKKLLKDLQRDGYHARKPQMEKNQEEETG